MEQPHGRSRPDSGYGAELQPMINNKNKPHPAISYALKRFGGLWKLFFFSAAVVTAAGGVIGVIGCMLEGDKPIGLWIINSYLIVFGLALMMIDFPDFKIGTEPAIIRYVNFVVSKYFLVFTRFMGRGLVFFYLSTIIVSSLWDNGVEPFLGFIFGGYVCFVGLVAFCMGIKRSYRLDRTKQSLKRQHNIKGTQFIELLCPQSGLTAEQFKELALQFNGENFSDEDLRYVMAALSNGARRSPYPVCRFQDFESWVVSDSMTWM